MGNEYLAVNLIIQMLWRSHRYLYLISFNSHIYNNPSLEIILSWIPCVFYALFWFYAKTKLFCWFIAINLCDQRELPLL